MILEMSCFSLGLILVVTPESVVLVVFLVLLRRSFAAFSLSGSFSIGFLSLKLSRDQYSFPYQSVGLLM